MRPAGENNFAGARFFAVLGAVIVSLQLSVSAGEVTLQDGLLLVAFDSASGALTRLEDKAAHWTIERRPELGVSFRLFAPLPDRRYNPVLGQRQRAVEVRKISASEVRLQWKNLVSENGGVLPMTLTAEVILTNGALTFDATFENGSPLTVETIDYPYLGDLNPPKRDASLEACVLRNGISGNYQTDEIYPHFRNEKGYWGIFYPLKTREAQSSPFCLIQAATGGIEVEVNAPAEPCRLQYTFEQHPGVISSISDLVPPQDEISGVPVHLEFRLCHFVFAPPHSTVTLAPIALRCYRGGWRTGVELYKSSRSGAASENAK